MAKQKKHHARHMGGIMGRSDIPFAQRMLYLDEDGNAYKPKKGELMDGN